MIDECARVPLNCLRARWTSTRAGLGGRWSSGNFGPSWGACGTKAVAEMVVCARPEGFVRQVQIWLSVVGECFSVQQPLPFSARRRVALTVSVFQSRR